MKTNKEEILEVKGCQTCPLSMWKDDGKGWRCTNFKRNDISTRIYNSSNGKILENEV